MGSLKEIARIETGNADYIVEAWRGAGYSTRHDYPKPAFLFKEETRGKSQLESWSSMYSKKEKPIKTDFQLATEALKKIRFYDDSEVLRFSVGDQELSSGDTIIQKNISSRNADWELYRVGAKKISHKTPLIERLMERAEPFYVVVNEEGEVVDQSERKSEQPREIPS